MGAWLTHLAKTRRGSDSLFLRRKASPPRASSFSSSRLYSFAFSCQTKSSATRPSHLSYLKSEKTFSNERIAWPVHVLVALSVYVIERRSSPRKLKSVGGGARQYE